MQFPWLPLLPLLHVLALFVLVGAVMHMKKNAALGGVLALVAFLCAAATAVFFVILFRTGF